MHHFVVIYENKSTCKDDPRNESELQGDLFEYDMLGQEENSCVFGKD